MVETASMQWLCLMLGNPPSHVVSQNCISNNILKYAECLVESYFVVRRTHIVRIVNCCWLNRPIHLFDYVGLNENSTIDKGLFSRIHKSGLMVIPTLNCRNDILMDSWNRLEIISNLKAIKHYLNKKQGLHAIWVWVTIKATCQSNVKSFIIL